MVSKGSHDDPVNALLENVRNWQKSLNDLVLILTYELGNSGAFTFFLVLLKPIINKLEFY